jgi:hypothetical protein
LNDEQNNHLKLSVMKKSIERPGLWLFTCIVIIIVSCQKDKNNDSNTARSKTELLTTGTWKYTGATINPAYDYYGDGVIVTNIFDIMKDCEKDDFEFYKANGTWEYNEGPTMCDPLYPQSFNLPWHFVDNETKLMLGGDEHTVLELTATSLKLKYSFEDAGVIYTEVDTYEH